MKDHITITLPDGTSEDFTLDEWSSLLNGISSAYTVEQYESGTEDERSAFEKLSRLGVTSEVEASSSSSD